MDSSRSAFCNGCKNRLILFLEEGYCHIAECTLFVGSNISIFSMIHIGMILFSDPADVAVEGTEDENVYPNTIFLPGTGVQRGSTYIGDGDPLSPHWPSIQNAYRTLE